MNSGEFESIVLPLKDRMFRLAKSVLCDADAAADSVQDVLEKLWIRRESLGDYDNLPAFVLICTRNACIDKIRRSRKTVDTSARQTVSAEAEGEQALLEKRDIKRIVEGLIAELPEKQQMVMYLRDIENCEFDEISSLLGIEQSAVRMNLSRARKTVREKLLRIMNHGL